MKRKKTSKVLWRALWKAYDFRKRALRRLRGYPDSPSQRARPRADSYRFNIQQTAADRWAVCRVISGGVQ